MKSRARVGRPDGIGCTGEALALAHTRAVREEATGTDHGRQNLAEKLSGRHAGRDRRRPLQLHPGPAREDRRQVRRQAGLPQPRPHPELCRAGAAVARFRRLSAGTAGHGQGRARRHHVAEPAAVPGGAVRHPARRHDGGERQSAVHAARARAPVEGLRRQGHRHRRELRQYPAAGAREHPGRARDHHPGRRPAADPEALDRQFRHQDGEEDGARWRIDGAITLPRGARARRGGAVHSRSR